MAIEPMPAVISALAVPAVITNAARRPSRWRTAAEGIVLPIGAVIAALVLFGVFCAFRGANPFGVFAAIYKAAFGSWYSFQNTLVRAAPLMLTALCTALPARLGLVVIGNEGALVAGGLGATAAGLAVASA